MKCWRAGRSGVLAFDLRGREVRVRVCRRGLLDGLKGEVGSCGGVGWYGYGFEVLRGVGVVVELSE